jgi:serine/threonine-protein kinase RsbW
MSPSDRIELVVPLRSEFAATVRTLAASVGADLGFSIDEIDDVRLAISEAFAVLVDGGGDPHVRARVTFEAPDGQLRARIGCDAPPISIQLDALAANILRSVTDGYEVSDDAITFVKHATERSGDRRVS